MAKRNSLDSWIDADRLGELLDEVRPGSLQRPSLPAAEALATDGPSLEQEGEPVESLLAEEIPERAFAKSVRPPLPPPEPPVPKPKQPPGDLEGDREAPSTINPLTLYFRPPDGPLETRTRAFLDWVRETSGSRSVFIVDAYGAAIAKDPDCDAVFLASVSNLADALGRGREHLSRPDQSALHLELGDDGILSLVQGKWDVATVALGMIRDEPLPREVAIRYREELVRLARRRRRRERD